jgi:hypothetical protein
MKAKSILVENLPTTNGVLYTVPPNTRAKWILAFVSNGTGSTISDVHIKIENDETITVLGSKSLGSGDFIQLKQDGGYVMLESGYQITGDAGSTGVSCILTVEETPFLVSTA